MIMQTSPIDLCIISYDVFLHYVAFTYVHNTCVGHLTQAGHFFNILSFDVLSFDILSFDILSFDIKSQHSASLSVFCG
jgi:hypothetical protein